MNYVYILKCKDNSLYTGWTNNLEKRINAHNNGCGAKYTRGRGPVKLMYFEVFEDKREAQSREYYIKKLTKEQKLKLINSKDIEEGTYEKEINV
ncbi:TPA: GIY-YIG nuclease family protein [Clostridium perfringens]